METITPRFDWSMTFLAVAECSGFSAAATQIGLSKAYVSKQVLQLEQVLGVTLLYRTTRRVTLTEAGRQYLDYCRQLRDTMEQARRAIGSLHAEVSGRIRLSAPVSLGVAFIGDMLLAFRRRYPETEIELDLSQQSRDLMSDGFDLALRMGPISDERVVAQPLALIQEWVVVAPDQVQQLGAIETPAALATQPCVINSYFSEGAQWLFMQNGESQCIRMQQNLCVNNYAALRHLVLAGVGYAKLPSYLVAQDVKEGTLLRVLADYTLPQTTLFLLTPPLRPQPARVRALMEFIRDWLSVHPVSERQVRGPATPSSV